MKKSILQGLTMLFVLMTILTSCSENDKEVSRQEPIISFTNDKDIYVVKVGEKVNIEPIIENEKGAMYSWTSGGKLLSKERNLSYSWDKNGQVFVVFKVITEFGEAEKEVRIDVANLVPPLISLSIPKDGYAILINQELKFTPTVDNSEEAKFKWTVDGKEVSTDKDYTFKSEKAGSFKVTLATENSDGNDLLEFVVSVKIPSDMSFSWIFEKTVYNLSKGRIIRLTPFTIRNAFNATYTWAIDGKEVQNGTNPMYAFEGLKEGTYPVSVTMKNNYAEVSQKLTVNVCPQEGTYRRQSTPSSLKDWNKVYEFLPAPGQFVNEDPNIMTMSQAIANAENRLRKDIYVSLGGFGGYIVLGFDHSIENDGGYNFQVIGNSFDGSSEPGVVSVMQDENGDGLPNDTWYELKGSEYGKAETISDYEVTYYRPRSIQMPVEWTDNKGKSGSVDYLAAYHKQDYYYPLWAKEDSYVLRGTCLKSRTREVTPGYWSNDSFEWGYADNFSLLDRLTTDGNANAGSNANHFKISDAVTFDGKAANLKYIDFIKIHTGVNAKAGWLGEISVEICGAKDYNLIKN
ncbi:MAG: PKD-like domain-containing protein [Rikenellaceae bacterium]